MSLKKDLKKIKIIKEILVKNGYLKLQYIPINFSYLGIIKEHENISNLIFKKKHLLFYYSVFPNFYKLFLSKETKLLLKIFYLNEKFILRDLNKIFKKKRLNEIISSSLVKKIKNKYQFSFSFVPFEKDIFIRDSYKEYTGWFDPKIKKNRVWIGADSIMFIRFIRKYLNIYKFNNVLEIGSGTGIVISFLSRNVKKCEGIEINNRALEFSKTNILLNKIKNTKIYYSNIYSKVKKKFDLVIANPWFVNLEKKGLEEVPLIVRNLEKVLNKNGVCLILMNSYIINNSDTIIKYLKSLIKIKKYDIKLYSNGCFYEFARYKDYKKFNVDYVISYTVEIKINGKGKLQIYQTPFLRAFRDYFFIKFMKFFNWLQG